MTKEERFFELIQKEAKKHNAKFFVSSGEGHEIINNELDGEDFSGWLIPLDKTEAFVEVLKKAEGKEFDDKWMKFFIFAIWREKSNGIKIEFKDFKG